MSTTTTHRRFWRRTAIILAIGFILGVIVVGYLQSKPPAVKNYATCVAYGFPVTGTTQKICTAADKTFQGPFIPYTKPVAVDVPFQTISAISGSGDYPEQNDILTNQSDWRVYWDKLHRSSDSKPVLPSIDFGTKVIVAISEGPHRSQAVGIQILSVKSVPTETVVSAIVIKPGETCRAEPYVLDPASIIAFDKQAGSIRFDIKYKTQECTN